jgi:tetratricopeptide (TPR) repeat protein
MNIYLKSILTFAILSIFLTAGLGQISRLANQYYANGEYEKAMVLYEQLYSENKSTDYYFQRYADCLINLKKYKEAEKIIQGEIKTRPSEIQLYVVLGNLYDRMAEPEKANKSYRSAMEKLDNNPQNIDKLARVFMNLAMYEEAIEVYERGQKMSKSNSSYSINLGELYRRTGNKPKMISNYLFALEFQNNRSDYIIQTLQKGLELEDIPELQTQLYAKIQKNPGDEVFEELLEWSFLTTKAYDRALRQARAVDLAKNGNGEKVYNIGKIAYDDEDYDTAIDAFNFILKNKSVNSPYFLDAQRYLLNSKRKKITGGFKYTKQDLIALRDEYESFLDLYGKNSRTASLIREYAQFKALYMNNLEKAIDLLNQVLKFGGVRPEEVAEAKLDLGDYYLMQGDPWEATLLYSQVDKTFKEGVLGEQARYRNAKLSYYSGDFEWAQAQFAILKAATTRLISNDAIYRDVFIMDHLNLDTTSVPMEMFAKAELLLFQNRIEEGMAMFDSLESMFPSHTLGEDILYQKAQVYKKTQQSELAILMYETLIEKYPEGILCDDAIFELAKMFDYQLGEKDKAMELYQSLFLDYTGSTYAVDARMRYRILRGDQL